MQNCRGDVLPLPADLAEQLRRWLPETPQDARLWPGRWAVNKAAGVCLKADLQAARDAWLSHAAEDTAKRDMLEQSDFLQWQDSEGRYADFHSLRHTYLSRLGRSGVSAKVMQRLARHSDVNLTLGRYTHADLDDLASAVDRLPALSVEGEADSPGVRPKATVDEDAVDRLPDRDASVVVAGMVAVSNGNHRDLMRSHATTEAGKSVSEGSSAASLKPCDLQGLESDCDHMTSGEGGIRRNLCRKQRLRNELRFVTTACVESPLVSRGRLCPSVDTIFGTL